MNLYYFHVEPKIMDIHIALHVFSEEHPFGRIDGAKLIVRDRIQQLHSASEPKRLGHLNFRTMRNCLSMVADTVRDEQLIADHPIMVEFMEVISYIERRPSPVGLMLAPVPGGHAAVRDESLELRGFSPVYDENFAAQNINTCVFRRLGIFKAMDNADPKICASFFDGTEEQEICLS
jgi:hypothetical protein